MDDVDNEFDEMFGQQEQIQEDKVPKNLTKYQFEKELIRKYQFKSMKDTKEIYYYDPVNGIYIKNADWLIEQEG
jgi:hypothetical protein